MTIDLTDAYFTTECMSGGPSSWTLDRNATPMRYPDRVGELLWLAPAYVRGVATFYTMYNKRPVGRHLVQVCTNISCNLCGAQDVVDAFLAHTNTELGETSIDGAFTVIEAECLAACGFPTCVQINSRYYENVTVEEVPRIVAHLRTKDDNVPAVPAVDAPSDDPQGEE